MNSCYVTGRDRRKAVDCFASQVVDVFRLSFVHHSHHELSRRCTLPPFRYNMAICLSASASIVTPLFLRVDYKELLVKSLSEAVPTTRAALGSGLFAKDVGCLEDPLFCNA